MLAAVCRLRSLPAVTCLLLAGCGSTPLLGPKYPAGDTPLATYESFQGAFRAGEYGAAFDLLTSAARTSFAHYVRGDPIDEEFFAAMGLSEAEFRALPTRKAFTRLHEAYEEVRPRELESARNAVILGEPIVLGDHGIIRRRLGNGAVEDFDMLRVEEKWYVDERR